MSGMMVRVLPRQGGKTTEMIALAAEEFAYIVCPTRERVMQIWRQAVEAAGDGPVPIPQPITWDDLVKGRYYPPGIKAFVIDDLDMCVQSMTSVPIRAVTLTGDTEAAARSAQSTAPSSS